MIPAKLVFALLVSALIAGSGCDVRLNSAAMPAALVASPIL